jgi:hypothetical protein
LTGFLCSGGPTRTDDLRVMSPTSYQLLHPALLFFDTPFVFRGANIHAFFLVSSKNDDFFKNKNHKSSKTLNLSILRNLRKSIPHQKLLLYEKEVSRIIMRTKPKIKPRTAMSVYFSRCVSGITSSTTTNTIAPAANAKAKGKIG